MPKASCGGVYAPNRAESCETRRRHQGQIVARRAGVAFFRGDESTRREAQAEAGPGGCRVIRNRDSRGHGRARNARVAAGGRPRARARASRARARREDRAEPSSRSRRMSKSPQSLWKTCGSRCVTALLPMQTSNDLANCTRSGRRLPRLRRDRRQRCTRRARGGGRRVCSCARVPRHRASTRRRTGRCVERARARSTTHREGAVP